MDEQAENSHDTGLDQLKAQLAAQQEARKQALRDLQAITRAATECTPTNGVSPPNAAQEDEVSDSGVRALPTTERLDVRLEQLTEARAARKMGLRKLKRTTYEAIRVVGDTTIMELGELKKRLDDEYGKSSAMGA